MKNFKGLCEKRRWVPDVDGETPVGGQTAIAVARLARRIGYTAQAPTRGQRY